MPGRQLPAPSRVAEQAQQARRLGGALLPRPAPAGADLGSPPGHFWGAWVLQAGASHLRAGRVHGDAPACPAAAWPQRRKLRPGLAPRPACRPGPVHLGCHHV